MLGLQSQLCLYHVGQTVVWDCAQFALHPGAHLILTANPRETLLLLIFMNVQTESEEV